MLMPRQINRMAISLPPDPTYMQSFNFISVVLPKILLVMLDEKSVTKSVSH